MRRYALRDDQWDRIKDFLPGREGLVGVTAKDNRLFVNGVLWVLRSGAHWHDLPERYGKWKSVHTRFARWAKSGVFERVFRLLASEHDNEYMMIDATIVLVVIVAVIALAALALAAMFRKEVLGAGEGTDNMKNIALAVQEGANAYLTRQFRTLGIFAAVAFVPLLALPAGERVMMLMTPRNELATYKDELGPRMTSTRSMSACTTTFIVRRRRRREAVECGQREPRSAMEEEVVDRPHAQGVEAGDFVGRGSSAIG